MRDVPPKIMAPPFPMRVACWVKDTAWEQHGLDGTVHHPWKKGDPQPVVCIRVTHDADGDEEFVTVAAITLGACEYDTAYSDHEKPLAEDSYKDWMSDRGHMPYVIEWWSEHDGEWLPV